MGFFEETQEDLKEIQEKYEILKRELKTLNEIYVDTLEKMHYYKDLKKTFSTLELLGCSIDEFVKFIEAKFTEGMTWDNYGEWHIDHIIPVSYGLNAEEVIALNNYINLQPLWARDNLRKSNRYIG